MKILLATSNPHKISELRPIFRGEPATGVSVDIIDLQDLSVNVSEPVENQETFEGNARLKALYYAAETDLICLADDSGLEVDALQGEPGVRSARYAGFIGPREVIDTANNTRLLQALDVMPTEQRTARFVCAMALAAPRDLPPDHPVARVLRSESRPMGDDAKVLHTVRGTIEGRILGPGDAGFDSSDLPGRGNNGFGYDPLFLVPSLGQTTAELPPEHKNRISHRGSAARKMWRWLRDTFA